MADETDYGGMVGRVQRFDLRKLPPAVLGAMFPDTASLLRGEPAPPIANLPATPGKVPTTDDPRTMGSILEIGTTLAPTPTGSVMAGAIPIVGKAAAKAAGKTAGKAAARELTPGMFVQLTGKDAAKEFHDIVARAKAAHPQGPAVELKSAKDYGAEGMKLFTTPDRSVAFAVKSDGDVVSVAKHPDSPFRNAGPAAVQRATQEGGSKLDAFDTVLPGIYGKAGYKEVARIPFNPEYKPEGWTEAAFSEFKGKTPRFAEKKEDVIVGGPGQPDVVGMVHNPPGRVASLPTPEFDYIADIQRLAQAGRHPAEFLPQAKRVMSPGIYDDPRTQARIAAANVPAEDPALKRLFGVSRQDLYDIAREREKTGLGTLPPPPGLPQNPRGSAAASAVMTPENRQRLVDTLAEGAKYPELLHGMYPWYIQDPLFQRMVERVGFDQAVADYPKFATFQGLASSRSKVPQEIQRGTAAYALNKQGRFPEFAAQTPTELDVPGHFFHKTHAKAMQGYLSTGKLPEGAVKTPAYIQSAGVPETGYSWEFPPGDLHFVGGLGLPDVRSGTTTPTLYANITPSELAAITPWWKGITADVGMNPSSGQAMNWALFAAPTGVKTDIGVPKLELQARSIMQRARETGKSPERVRDEGLEGLERWGIFLAPTAGIPAAGVFTQPELVDYY